jgi:hypothetical protein
LCSFSVFRHLRCIGSSGRALVVRIVVGMVTGITHTRSRHVETGICVYSKHRGSKQAKPSKHIANRLPRVRNNFLKMGPDLQCLTWQGDTMLLSGNIGKRVTTHDPRSWRSLLRVVQWCSAAPPSPCQVGCHPLSHSPFPITTILLALLQQLSTPLPAAAEYILVRTHIIHNLNHASLRTRLDLPCNTNETLLHA